MATSRIAEFLEREWQAVSAAPYLFLSTVIAVAAVIWVVLNWYYRGQLKNKDARIESLEERIKLRDDQIDLHKDSERIRPLLNQLLKGRAEREDGST